MKTKTLIEKALEVQVKNPVSKTEWTDDHLDLVFAYLNGEVSNKQMTVAAGAPVSGATHYVGSVLTWAVRNRKIGRI